MTNLKIDDLFSVRGKVVGVTGGSRGIGEMIAAGFLANGAKVYISSRKAEVCDASAERLAAEHGGTCVSIPANLAGLEGIDGFVAQLGGSWTPTSGGVLPDPAAAVLLEAAASAEDPAQVVNIGSIDGMRTPTFDNLCSLASVGQWKDTA